MIELASRNECTGCGACLNVCNHNAIDLKHDNEGFSIPFIDFSKCKECGLCIKCCPQLNKSRKSICNQHSYAVFSYHDRKRSSSGGAFSLFSRYVLARNGIVFGASFYKRDENDCYLNQFPKLQHIFVDKIKDLEYLRGSKYVQSDIGYSYREVKEFIKNERMVLFTGTPCQIAGLYKFLGKRYENLLITLDLVCHGVPSQGCFDSYINKLENSSRLKGEHIKAMRFRKLDSWDYRPSINLTESEWQTLNQEDNVFMNSFFKLMTFRECCYNCMYSNMNRIGTFTIADYLGIGKNGLRFSKNVSAGVSLVIDNEDKMPSMIEELRKLAYIEERPLEEGRKYNHNLNLPSLRPKERDTAVSDMLDENISLLDYSKKYQLLDGSIKFFFKSIIKNIVYIMGLYNVYKTISYRLGRPS